MAYNIASIQKSKTINLLIKLYLYESLNTIKTSWDMDEKIDVTNGEELKAAYDENGNNKCLSLNIKITNQEFLNFIKCHAGSFDDCDIELSGDPLSFDSDFPIFSLLFYKCTFNTKIIWDSISYGSPNVIYYEGGHKLEINFKACTFKENIIFSKISMMGRGCSLDVKFENCTINRNVKFENSSRINVEFKVGTYSKHSAIKLNDCRDLILNLEDTDLNKLTVSNCGDTAAVQSDSDVTIKKLCFVSFKNSFRLDYNALGIEILYIKDCNFNGVINWNIKKQFFKEVVFDKELDYKNKEIDCLKAINCTFKEGVVLDGAKITTVNFKKPVFPNKLNCKRAKISELKVLECTFDKDVILDESIISVIDFSDSIFKERLNFINGYVDSLTFSNCEFNKTTKIVNPKGIKDEGSTKKISAVCFERCTIKTKFFFNGWKDEIIYLKKDALVDFSHLFVDNSGYVIIRNINKSGVGSGRTNGYFNFEYANILGAVTIQESCFELLNFRNSTIVGDISLVQTKTGYKHYETLTKLKNSAIKENDTISALKYKSDEMKSYSGTSESGYNWFQKIVKGINKYWGLTLLTGILFPLLFPLLLIASIFPSKKMEAFGTFALLFLNRISNSFGQSWVRGVIFTVICSFLFYSLYSLSTGKYEMTCTFSNWVVMDGEYWIKVLNYLWILSGIDELKSLKDTNLWNYTLYISGKIFIGYGIYQTISAFRKYGK